MTVVRRSRRPLRRPVSSARRLETEPLPASGEPVAPRTTAVDPLHPVLAEPPSLEVGRGDRWRGARVGLALMAPAGALAALARLPFDAPLLLALVVASLLGAGAVLLERRLLERWAARRTAETERRERTATLEIAALRTRAEELRAARPIEREARRAAVAAAQTEWERVFAAEAQALRTERERYQANALYRADQLAVIARSGTAEAEAERRGLGDERARLLELDAGNERVMAAREAAAAAARESVEAEIALAQRLLIEAARRHDERRWRKAVAVRESALASEEERLELARASLEGELAAMRGELDELRRIAASARAALGEANGRGESAEAEAASAESLREIAVSLRASAARADEEASRRRVALERRVRELERELAPLARGIRR